MMVSPGELTREHVHCAAHLSLAAVGAFMIVLAFAWIAMHATHAALAEIPNRLSAHSDLMSAGFAPLTGGT